MAHYVSNETEQLLIKLERLSYEEELSYKKAMSALRLIKLLAGRQNGNA